MLGGDGRSSNKEMTEKEMCICTEDVIVWPANWNKGMIVAAQVRIITVCYGVGEDLKGGDYASSGDETC